MDKLRSLANDLNLTFNSFKGLIISSKGCSMKVTNIRADIIDNKTSYEVNVTFYYRFVSVPQKNTTKKFVEDDLFDRFVNDIIKSAIKKWSEQNEIKMRVS